MENLSYSRQPNTVSKKSCNGTTTNTKTIYDDVFGGPPRYGAPTLSPRVEDYAEIFSGFHAPRASSIPVLDLPLLDEEAEVFFDVRSSGCDYGDVFGGYNNGPDFAVSYEELMMTMMNGRDSSSDDDEEAWTPEEVENLSQELNHSTTNQYLSNGDSYESIDGSLEFNISYHKASRSSNDHMSNGFTHVTPLHDIPGYTFVVDKSTSLPRTDDEHPPLQVNDGHLNINFSGEMVRGRHLRKTMSNPANGSVSGPLFGHDDRPHTRYIRNGSLPKETFVTISDVNLRTQPSQLPPPSRPPPALDINGRDSGKSTPNCKNVTCEGTAGDNSPPYFDVEVDASSSAAASAAAMKEAMEKAQAKLKSAKELMEKKREGFQSRTKLSSKTNKKVKEGNVTKIVDDSDGRTNGPVQGSCEREENKMGFSVLEEGQRDIKTSPLIPDSTEVKKHPDVAKKFVEEKHGRESISSQGSDKMVGAGEWKEATEFFELVRTDTYRKAFDQANDENILVQNPHIHELVPEGKKAAMESSRQHQEKKKRVKAVRPDQELEEHVNKSEVSIDVSEWEGNNGRSEVAKMAHRQQKLEKVQTAQEAFRLEENEKKTKRDRLPLGTEKNQTRADDFQKPENTAMVQHKESNFELKPTMKHKEKKQQLKEVNKSMEDEKRFTLERDGCERREREALEREENEQKIKAALGQAENERRQKEALEQEEKQKRMKEIHEREENEKKQKEAYEREEHEKGLREALEQEENDRRLKEVLEKEENERKLKEAHEKEANERRQREAVEREENERRQREAVKWEENEKRQREAHEREENEKRLKEVLEKEENERRLKEAVEQEVNEKRQRQAREREENEKRLKEALEWEKSMKEQKEAQEREETEKRYGEAPEKGTREAQESEEIARSLEEPCEQEDDGKTLMGAQEGEESKTGQKEVCEPEESRDPSQEVCKCESEQLMGLNKIGKDHSVCNQACALDAGKNCEATQTAGKHEENSERPDAAEEIAYEEIGKIPTRPRQSEKESVLVDGNTSVPVVAQGNSEHEKNQFLAEDVTESNYANDRMKKAGEAGSGIGQKNFEKMKSVSQVDSDIGNQGKKLIHESGETGKTLQAQVILNQGENRDQFMSAKLAKVSVETGRKMEAAQQAAQQATLEVKGNSLRTVQQVNASQSTERKVKNLNETISSQEKEAERTKREKDLEEEHLRKIEEEREREREREKDRMAVDKVTLEVRERAYAEARERAEWAAVEKAAEARQRALNEARERLEKACAEAREKSLADKTSTEARSRAERAAVERATAEVRLRAEKAMAEKATFDSRGRVERSVSDKFSASSRNSGMRPSYSSSDLQDLQSQSTGSFSGSRHPYSAEGSYNMDRSEGLEGESPQRCKARLERHRRTAERAAKALAEKNKRDLLAQREQAERNRLAETLDADVKRWSSGKEGNLRALLSTLQYILGPDSGWQPIPLTEVITAAAVKKAYRKATLCVHPDKLQQRGASIQQKYICEKVFDLLKEAWNKFNSEER